MGQTYKAFVIEEQEDGFKRTIKEVNTDKLPEGELLIKVHYSSLNYKDALSANGNKGVTRSYPHTPGIDAVGIVEESVSAKFSIGDKVIVTSYDLGMNTSGGFGEYIRVPADWALQLPAGLSMSEAMMYGTAGLTAAMSVVRLCELVQPEDGKVLVSGSTGGVGSLSVAILSKLGYSVSAITGKESEAGYLKSLGADEVILRKDFEESDKRPMIKALYAGAIDTVGGIILENVLKSIQPMGVVTCCGNVASPKLNTTVFPFILRGISLIGIDSQNYPMRYRQAAWYNLAEKWKPEQLSDMCDEVSLKELDTKIDLMLAGKLKRRVLVKL